MPEFLENKTLDEIQIGDSASLTRTLRSEDLETWAAVTGNINLVRALDAAAKEGVPGQGGGVAMWSTALFSTIIGAQLPGAGTILWDLRAGFARSQRPKGWTSVRTHSSMSSTATKRRNGPWR